MQIYYNYEKDFFIHANDYPGKPYIVPRLLRKKGNLYYIQKNEKLQNKLKKVNFSPRNISRKK
ncbi:MAG: hypothetical protein ACTSVL_03740 [Promethearchaeota archaeon]